MLTLYAAEVQLGKLSRSDLVRVVDDRWRITAKGRKRLAQEKPWTYRRAVRTMFRDD